MIASTSTNGPRTPSCFNEQQASDQREATYMAGISQLCSQSDLLVAEAIKIRGLRKAKYQVDQQALKEIMRTHSDEVLAMGDTLARNRPRVASVTSELRRPLSPCARS